MGGCENMKILYVTHYSELLGANRSLLGLLKYVRAHTNHTPIVLVPRHQGDFNSELDALGIEYHRCFIYSTMYVGKGWLSKIKNLIKAAINCFVSFYLFLKLKKKGINLIHTNSSVINIGAYLSCLMKVPHVWHFREFAKEHYKCSFNLGDAYQYYVWNNCATVIIAVSNSLRDYFSKFLTKPRIVTIYNGVSTSNKMIVEKGKNMFHLAVIGLVYEGKHPDVILKALNRVVYVDHIYNVHLHVFGGFSDKRYEATILSMVDDLKLKDYVSFYGYISNVVEKSQFCHIGILASENEAFGRVTIEYMGNGMIPIVSNSGANTELIVNKQNGLVFEVNNVVDLANCINEVVRNYESYGYMIDNAVKMSKKFTIEANAEKICALYDEITNGRE